MATRCPPRPGQTREEATLEELTAEMAGGSELSHEPLPVREALRRAADCARRQLERVS